MMFAIDTFVCIIDTTIQIRQAMDMDEEALYRNLGEAIAARRKQLGFTQATLAARIGLSRASVANIEVGRQKTLLHHVYLFAEALELGGVEHLLPAVPQSGERGEVVSIRPESDLTAKQRAQVERLVRSSKPLRMRKGNG